MTDRITSTPGDVMALVIGQMDEDCRARHPGAFGAYALPDPEAMPDAEWAVRKAMLDLNQLDQLDHEARARQWERIMELVSDAADYEWRQAKGEGS